MADLRAITDIHDEPVCNLKCYQIFLDGIDKTGKDLIRSYIFYLGKGKYICIARGIASMRVYSALYNRPYEYDDACQKNVVNVLLTVDKEDWEVRCKAANEPLTNYEKEKALFEKEFLALEDKGYDVLRFNTSKFTPYVIAKLIIKHMEKINGNNQ